MSLWRIAWVSLAERRLSSLLTGLSMALGVALVVAVLVIHGVVQDSFRRAAHGYDLIVGAKGGRLQLVLNTVYHLSQPIENIPWSYYREFAEPGGRFASQVAVAIPYCLGDNYEGFRVVGTRREMFEELEYAAGKNYRFSAGRNFGAEAFFEAVIGSVVARRTGLKVGDRFQSTHGLSDAGHLHEHDSFVVVGVLAPTGTPNDRALFVNIEGFFLLDGHAKPVDEAAGGKPPAEGTDEAPGEAHGHAHEAVHAEEHAHEGSEAEHGDEPDHEHVAGEEHAHDEEHDHAHEQEHAHEHEDAHEHVGEHAEHDEHEHGHDHAHGQPAPLPEAQREVTAILVRSSNVLAGLSLPKMINKDQVAQAVMPVREITSLFEGVVGNIHKLMLALAVLVVIVAGIGIMVAIYNTMNERRREIAIMRALGADRRTVMLVVLLESVLLALAGGLAGVLLGHGAIGLLNPWIVDQTGVTIPIWQFARQELLLIPGLIVLAALAGYVPALNAYRTDVGRALGTAP